MGRATDRPDLSSEFLARIMRVIEDSPDMRPDRVEAARRRMDEGHPDSREVAEKMVSRIISDALR